MEPFHILVFAEPYLGLAEPYLGLAEPYLGLAEPLESENPTKVLQGTGYQK